MRNTILKYIFFKTCFYSKTYEKIKAIYLTSCVPNLRLISKNELSVIFVWMQYQTFPLVELCFPFISNVVIFDRNKYKCVCFFQDHLTFSNFKTLFVCVRAHITNAKTFTKLHTKMLQFSVKRPKNLLLLTCYFSIIDTVLQLLFIFWIRFDFYNFCFYFHFTVLVVCFCHSFY